MSSAGATIACSRAAVAAMMAPFIEMSWRHVAGVRACRIAAGTSTSHVDFVEQSLGEIDIVAARIANRRTKSSRSA